MPENIWRPFRCLITESIFSKTCIRTSSGIDFTQTCMRFCVFIFSKCPYFLISATGVFVSLVLLLRAFCVLDILSASQFEDLFMYPPPPP